MLVNHEGLSTCLRQLSNRKREERRTLPVHICGAFSAGLCASDIADCFETGIEHPNCRAVNTSSRVSATKESVMVGSD